MAPKKFPSHLVDTPHDEPPGRLDNEPSAPDVNAQQVPSWQLFTCRCGRTVKVIDAVVVDSGPFRGTRCSASCISEKQRCRFAAIGMVCVLEAGHREEGPFGSHHMVATRYVDPDKPWPWSAEKIAAFQAQYSEER